MKRKKEYTCRRAAVCRQAGEYQACTYSDGSRCEVDDAQELSTKREFIMIAEKFYKWKMRAPIARNVRELRRLLAELPDNLPINQGYTQAGGAALVVYNIKEPTMHLAFEESEEDEEDEEGI